jgi:beta-glucosidase
MYRDATVFPCQLAAACSWDAALLEMQGNVTAFEMRHTGAHWTFGPVLCIARDARWGRVDETFGEDPFLIGHLASAVVRGLQGRPGDPDKVLACAKHFAGYSETEGGRDSSESSNSRRRLRSWFLPPFEAVVREGVGSMMVSYQATDGVPSTANRWLLVDVLRREWGFEGLLVTDYDNVGHLANEQRVAKDLREAAATALNAGNNMILASPQFFDAGIEAVGGGLVNLSTLDGAVQKVLEAKFTLGLFEDPRIPDEAAARDRIGSPFSRLQAKRLSEESLVLLKNDGILPLANSYKRIAVVGPIADDDRTMDGDWSSRWHQKNLTITVLAGLRARFAGQIVYEVGANMYEERYRWIEDAVSEVLKSDLTVAVVGDVLHYYGEANPSATLELMGSQHELLSRIVATGKKFVLVVIASKPLVIPEWVIEKASAIIWQFCPGMLGGTATAGAIFGDFNPSGRLPISIPRHVGQLPVFYQRIRGVHGRGYADMTDDPMWAFGFGMTFCKIDYDGAAIDKKAYRIGEEIRVKVAVINRGAYDAVEIVQVYVSDVVTSVTWADQELKGFARVNIPAGQKAEATVIVKTQDCSIVNGQGGRVVEPGDFEIRVGKAANNIKFIIPFAIEADGEREARTGGL